MPLMCVIIGVFGILCWVIKYDIFLLLRSALGITEFCFAQFLSCDINLLGFGLFYYDLEQMSLTQN